MSTYLVKNSSNVVDHESEMKRTKYLEMARSNQLPQRKLLELFAGGALCHIYTENNDGWNTITYKRKEKPTNNESDV